MSPAFTWDANAYADAASVQHQWGVALMGLRTWRGDERVMDAGCGAGNVTAELLARIPRGHCVAVDVDAGMVAKARQRLVGEGSRVEVLQADLVALPAVEPVDVVFSNAVFHWVPDHDKLFVEIFRHLRPGGELLAQCGGEGNLEKVRGLTESIRREPEFEPYFRDWKAPWNYQDDSSTQERLLITGFVEPKVSLSTAPARFPDDASLARFLRAVILRSHFARLPDEPTRERLVARLVARMQETGLDRTLDYVRLTVRATRPPHPS